MFGITGMLAGGETIRGIREAVKDGRLRESFRPVDVNTALGMDYAGVFQPKHRDGNRGGNTTLFVQIERGLYRLKD